MCQRKRAATKSQTAGREIFRPTMEGVAPTLRALHDGSCSLPRLSATTTTASALAAALSAGPVILTDAADRWPAAEAISTLFCGHTNKSASDRRKLHAGRPHARGARGALVLARDAALPRARARRRHRLPAAAHAVRAAAGAARRVARAAVRDAAAVPLLGQPRLALRAGRRGGRRHAVARRRVQHVGVERAGGRREAVGAVPARRRAARRAARRRLPHAVRARRAARVVCRGAAGAAARRAPAPLHAARRRDSDDASGVVAHRAQPVAALCALAQFRARRAVGAGAGRRRGRRAAAGARRAAPRRARGRRGGGRRRRRRRRGGRVAPLPGRSARRVAAAAAAAAAAGRRRCRRSGRAPAARRAPRW